MIDVHLFLLCGPTPAGHSKGDAVSTSSMTASGRAISVADAKVGAMPASGNQMYSRSVPVAPVGPPPPVSAI